MKILIRMKKVFLTVIIGIFISNTPLAFAISYEDDIYQFKNYLQQIKSVAIDFTQTDSQGNSAAGKMLISKPYRFRCNYYPPFPLLVLGNKNFVTIYDYDMQQVSRIKHAENIFNFLIDDESNFDKDFIFESISKENNILSMTVFHNKIGKRIFIAFDQGSKQIQTIKIFEDNNIITINFYNIIEVKKFDKDLFIFRNPELFGVPARLKKAEIEKKYN